VVVENQIQVQLKAGHCVRTELVWLVEHILSLKIPGMMFQFKCSLCKENYINKKSVSQFVKGHIKPSLF